MKNPLPFTGTLPLNHLELSFNDVSLVFSFFVPLGITGRKCHFSFWKLLLTNLIIDNNLYNTDYNPTHFDFASVMHRLTIQALKGLK